MRALGEPVLFLPIEIAPLPFKIQGKSREAS